MIIKRNVVEKSSEKTSKLKTNGITKKISEKKPKKIINLKVAAIKDEVRKNTRNLRLRKTSILAQTKIVKVSQKESVVNVAKKAGNKNRLSDAAGKAKTLRKEQRDQKNERSKVSGRSLKRKRPGKERTKTESKLNAGSSTTVVAQKQGRWKRNTKKSQEIADNFQTKDLSRQHILQCIGAIFHLTQEQLKSKNSLFDGESHPLFMQVTCIRVPRTPRRQMRILLPHSIVSPGDEVALFVCDLQRGRRKDFEPTVEHYQSLLDKHGCTCIKRVIPLNQVKTEYDQYELKRKLVSSYDHFLVDGRIAGHLSHLLGSEFYKKRRLPASIRIGSKDLKHEIEHALKKTTIQIHSFGDTHITQIGHTSMKKKQVYENIVAACKNLSKNYPGGWVNIRSIQIKTATSISLPIYISLRSKNSVRVPVIRPKRPKAYHDVEGELSTLSVNATVTVTPEGEVKVKKNRRSES